MEAQAVPGVLLPKEETWQNGASFMDLLVPQLDIRDFMVIQLVCKSWCQQARLCLKEAVLLHPATDVASLARAYPNLTHLDLTHVYNLSVAHVASLTVLTGLQDLRIISLQGYTLPAAGESPAPASLHHPAHRWPNRQPGDISPTEHLRNKRKSRREESDEDEVTFAHPGPGLPPASCKTPTKLFRGPGRDRQLGSGPDSAATDAIPQERRAGESPRTQEAEQQLLPPSAQPGCVQGFTVAPVGAGLPQPATPVRNRVVIDVGKRRSASAAQAGMMRVLKGLTRLKTDICPCITPQLLSELTCLRELNITPLTSLACLTQLPHLTQLVTRSLTSSEDLSKLQSLRSLSVLNDSLQAGQLVSPREVLAACTALPDLHHLCFKAAISKKQPALNTDVWAGLSRLTSLELSLSDQLMLNQLPHLTRALTRLTHLSLDVLRTEGAEMQLELVTPPALQHFTLSADKNYRSGLATLHLGCSVKHLKLKLFWCDVILLPLTPHITPPCDSCDGSSPASSSGTPQPSPATRAQHITAAQQQHLPPPPPLLPAWVHSPMGDTATEPGPSRAAPTASTSPETAHVGCSSRPARGYQRACEDGGAASEAGDAAESSDAGLDLTSPHIGHLALSGVQLESIVLDSNFRAASSAFLTSLAGMPLTRLTMHDCMGLQNNDLHVITRLRSLRHVSLSGTHHLITDEGLMCLGTLPLLQTFVLSGNEAGWDAPSLEPYTRQAPAPRCTGHQVTGHFLRSLAACRFLTHLILKSCDSLKQDTLIKGLRQLTSLEELHVKNCSGMGDDVMCQAVTQLQRLKQLSVTHCQVTVGRQCVLQVFGPRLAMDMQGCCIPDALRVVERASSSILGAQEIRISAGRGA